MDYSSDCELETSREREYSVLDTLNRMEIPKDMLEFVPHFKPQGSMRRLQKVIELICLDSDSEDDEGIPLDELESFDYGSYNREIRVKAEEIASSKRAEESFSLETFKGPSDKLYEVMEIKQESNANDTTLEIPPVETESEKENNPNNVVHNERNLKALYAVTAVKKNQGITFKINAKSEFRQSQIGLKSIAPPPPINPRLDPKCSRNAVRELNSGITQMRDPVDSMKRNKLGQIISIKPLQ